MKTLIKYELIFNGISNNFIEEFLNPALIEKKLNSIEISNSRYFWYVPDKEETFLIEKFKNICNEFNIKCKFNLVNKLNDSYLNNYKKYVKPVLIENILIKPSWCEISIIEIDPETAFGTGQHETTQLVLKAMQKIKDRKSFLDIGTGSGILSIAAAKLGFKKIVSFDKDLEACNVALKNLKKNSVNNVNIFCGTIESLKFEKKFQIVVANIISSVLINLKNKIKNIVENGGFLILSGILVDELDNFKKKFDLSNVILLEELIINEWCCILIKKR